MATFPRLFNKGGEMFPVMFNLLIWRDLFRNGATAKKTFPKNLLAHPASKSYSINS